MCPIIIAPVQGPHDDIKALLDLYNDHEFVRYAIDSCTLAPGQSTIIYRLESSPSCGLFLLLFLFFCSNH